MIHDGSIVGGEERWGCIESGGARILTKMDFGLFTALQFVNERLATLARRTS